jgi:hypothetical protein
VKRKKIPTAKNLHKRRGDNYQEADVPPRKQDAHVAVSQ